MSLSSTIRAHRIRMDRLDLKLDHDTSKYRSMRPLEEHGTHIIRTFQRVFNQMSPDERKTLLSLANAEMPDAAFRRMMKLGLQS